MERLGDDELLYIFDKIPEHSHDRKAFLQVSKRFMKIACARLKKFRCSFPDLLFDILPSSPDIRFFFCASQLSNTHLKLLAHCPKLLSLTLSRERDFDPCSDSSEFDFDDDGLCAVANACIHLCEVHLDKRVNVGDAGVIALATSCKILTILHLESINITDESLKAIARSGIGSGIGYLQLFGCDRITDSGLIHLKRMVHLTNLRLGRCGVNITEVGIVGLVSQLSNIESLNLSGLNITDVTLLAIGTKCLKLERICFSGCESITSQGLQGFRGHQTLRDLQVLWCYNLCWEDVKSVALTCMELEYVRVSKNMMAPMPEEDESFSRIGDAYYLLVGDYYRQVDICDE